MTKDNFHSYIYKVVVQQAQTVYAMLGGKCKILVLSFTQPSVSWDRTQLQKGTTAETQPLWLMPSDNGAIMININQNTAI